jgi:hypothetical protein
MIFIAAECRQLLKNETATYAVFAAETTVVTSKFHFLSSQ